MAESDSEVWVFSFAQADPGQVSKQSDKIIIQDYSLIFLQEMVSWARSFQPGKETV